MTANGYKLIIHVAFVCIFLIVFLPVIIFLLKTRRQRLSDILAYFDQAAVKCYYVQFRPSQPVGSRTKDDFDRDIKKQFSWLFYVPPLLLLFALVLFLIIGADQTLVSWFKLDSGKGFAFSGLGMSALAGAAIWIVSDELDRLRRRDFTTTDVYNYVFRLLLATPFAWALSRILAETAGLPVALFLGGFPSTTLFQIARRIGAKQLNLGDDPATGALELESLQCVNKANAERYQDEGIQTISQLAYCDPIETTLRTNFDFNYVVDCVSQALLWIYLPNRGTTLFPLSLRGAQEVTSFVSALNGAGAAHDKALIALQAAATQIQVPPEALQLTLEQVDADPYTKFLWEVWH